MSGMVRSAHFHRLRRGRACLRMGFQASQDGLLCFFPDPESGAPHVAKGMTLEFTVK